MSENIKALEILTQMQSIDMKSDNTVVITAKKEDDRLESMQSFDIETNGHRYTIETDSKFIVEAFSEIKVNPENITNK